MDLSALELTPNKEKALMNKGFNSVEDVRNFFPRLYFDFTQNKPLDPQNSGQNIAVIGTIMSTTTKKTNDTLMVMAKVLDSLTQNKLNVMWIGHYYMYNIIKEWDDEKVIVCGYLEYSEEYKSYKMLNPFIFDTDIAYNLKVHTIYKKFSRISDESMRLAVKRALQIKAEDPIPEKYRKKYGLMEINEAYKAIHNPQSLEIVEKAKQRFYYEKMFGFAYSIESQNSMESKGSPFNIITTKLLSEIMHNLPYELTESQNTAIFGMCDNAIEGKRINALIEGDVGSGKTIVAFLIMIALAQSGYQTVLMAPTVILAKQHYENLLNLLDKNDAENVIKPMLLTGDLKAKEKKAVITAIEDNECNILIGTHGVASEKINYHNLALVVIDEEHKFGVEQRELVKKCASPGAHHIAMSATPIPRTLATIMFGENTTIYDLETPKTRKPVQTAVFNNEQKIFEFIEKKIDTGNQAYVVCPFIKDEDEKYNVDTVYETFERYNNYFSGKNIRVEFITGEMKSMEIDPIINDFAHGIVKILVSTTIIEVGISVPDANIIVINNAERFGLSSLHQLRGRVGRGEKQGYCILNSAEKENERLNTLCTETDGFKIAQRDMELRGTGDVLGFDQSGQNEYINLILRYPKVYEYAKRDAREYFREKLLPNL